jgi:hypothetical protein
LHNRVASAGLLIGPGLPGDSHLIPVLNDIHQSVDIANAGLFQPNNVNIVFGVRADRAAVSVIQQIMRLPAINFIK